MSSRSGSPHTGIISAAPYRDRVVSILDCYANQKFKGTYRALDRCTEYARRFRHVFQGDVRKFFPSIDHQILLARLTRKIWDPRVLDLGARHESDSRRTY